MYSILVYMHVAFMLHATCATEHSNGAGNYIDHAAAAAAAAASTMCMAWMRLSRALELL